MKKGFEEGLDPENWKELRDLGHRMVNDMFAYLEKVGERPVWQSIPESTKENFKSPLPLEPSRAENVYQEFLRDVLPYPTGNIHPRFWGWVMGTGTPFGMLVDMLAAGMNSHVAGYEQAATYVERQVLEWLSEMMGFPADSSGLLVSGGTAANLVGLTVARYDRAGFDVRENGFQGFKSPPLTVYCSNETHSWAQKSMELLGLGNSYLKRIPVKENFEINIDLLEEKISIDRQSGERPICIIGTAGTVNTGATDDLEGLAELSRRENLWFHIDGAFGALARLSPKHRRLVEGMEKADSLAFDLHKWMYLPYEIGCVLIKKRESHHGAFSLTPDYLTSFERGLAVDSLAFADLGIQLSRGFRALKVWMSLKAHGVKQFGRIIEQNIEQAQFLKKLIENNSNLELLAPAPLNVICFRFYENGFDEMELKELNEEILLRLQEKGIAVMSGTLIGGRFAMRVANTNQRSRQKDFEILVKAVVDCGKNLVLAL